MSDPTDNADNHSFAIEPLDMDRVYENYLRTCAMSGVEPVSRERALGLMQEWTEVLSGRPEPTTQERARPLSTRTGRSGDRKADTHWPSCDPTVVGGMALPLAAESPLARRYKERRQERLPEHCRRTPCERGTRSH